MIKSEHITIGGRELIYTYSDIGMKIERNDGIIYEDAVDPIDSGRTYKETDIPLPSPYQTEEEEKAAAYDILVGGADNE